METLQSRLDDVIAEFELVGGWNDRYRLLVQWGEEAAPLPEAECVSETEVYGCTSPLWLKAWKQGSLLHVQGSSPGILPKALVALLQHLFDGLEFSSELKSTAQLIDDLQLRRHLSPTRLLVLEKMLDRALAAASTP